jgi:MFS family permease
MFRMAVGQSIASPAAAPTRLLAYRWIHVGVAALAMVLTLPGRTQGLGLFTEPLLKSLSLDRQSYGFLNLWATLLGATFCIPCGYLLDSLGTRAVLFGVTVALGAAVLAMSQFATGTWAYPISIDLPESLGGPINLVFMADLFLFLLLTRGLGQSALSVVSLALIGRSAGRKAGPAMGVFAVATSIGFMAAFAILGRPNEWRPAWAGIGVAVLVLGPIGALLIRNRSLDAEPVRTDTTGPDEPSFTLGQALASPTFWTFSLATSFLGMVLSGTSLFGESLIAERGLGESALEGYGFTVGFIKVYFLKKVFVNVALVGIPFGLAANLTVGWLATRVPLGRLMALAMALFGAALLTFPLVKTEAAVYAYAVTLAMSGGGMSVCFYTVYRRAFGPAHLGSIQGLAQMMTVILSAVGPQVFASAKARLGSYSQLFPYFAGIAFALALGTWLIGLPRRPGPAPITYSETTDPNGGTP